MADPAEPDPSVVKLVSDLADQTYKNLMLDAVMHVGTQYFFSVMSLVCARAVAGMYVARLNESGDRKEAEKILNMFIGAAKCHFKGKNVDMDLMFCDMTPETKA